MNKIAIDQVDKALLIVPLWRSQPWFPLLLSYMISFPVRLPHHKDLLTLPHSGQHHPLSKRLTMVAVMLSGRDWRVKEFQDQQLASLSTHGEMVPESNTVWHGKSGIFGVFLDKLIPLIRLKQL